MAVLAVLAATSDGGWEGWIRTLTINAKIRIVPNDDRASDRAPDYRVLVGVADVGAAWRQTGGETTRLAVRFSDPAFPAGLAMTLFGSDEGIRANLVWHPPKHSQKEAAA